MMFKSVGLVAKKMVAHSSSLFVFVFLSPLHSTAHAQSAIPFVSRYQVAPPAIYLDNAALPPPGTATKASMPSQKAFRSAKTVPADSLARTTNSAQTPVVNTPAVMAIIQMVMEDSPPVIEVVRTPSTMVANVPFSFSWRASESTSLSRSCGAAGSGFSSNETLPTTGNSDGIASAAWLNYPSTCIWTATGPGGTTFAQEIMTTVANHFDSAVFINQGAPATMVPGTAYPVSVIMLNTGTRNWELADNIQLGSLNPDDNMIWGLNRVNLNEVIRPGQAKKFDFTVTAPAQPGIYNFQWSLLKGGQRFGSSSGNLTLASMSPPPVLNIIRTPKQMMAEAIYTVEWNSSAATSISYICSGMSDSVSFAPSGQYSALASRSWVNASASCTWTAIGPGGTTQFIEVLSTALPAPYCN